MAEIKAGISRGPTGRKRFKLPSKEEAQAELARLRRQERRAERKRKKTLEAQGIPCDDQGEPLPPVTAPAARMGKLKSAEELKQDFQDAFDELGGVAGLIEWGRRYPKEFYAIWTRLNVPRAEAAPSNSAGSLEDMLARLDGNGESMQ